jgi:hypothetical protein
LTGFDASHNPPGTSADGSERVTKVILNFHVSLALTTVHWKEHVTTALSLLQLESIKIWQGRRGVLDAFANFGVGVLDVWVFQRDWSG